MLYVFCFGGSGMSFLMRLTNHRPWITTIRSSAVCAWRINNNKEKQSEREGGRESDKDMVLIMWYTLHRLICKPIDSMGILSSRERKTHTHREGKRESELCIYLSVPHSYTHIRHQKSYLPSSSIGTINHFDFGWNLDTCAHSTCGGVDFLVRGYLPDVSIQFKHSSLFLLNLPHLIPSTVAFLDCSACLFRINRVKGFTHQTHVHSERGRERKPPTQCNQQLYIELMVRNNATNLRRCHTKYTQRQRTTHYCSIH